MKLSHNVRTHRLRARYVIHICKRVQWCVVCERGQRRHGVEVLNLGLIKGTGYRQEMKEQAQNKMNRVHTRNAQSINFAHKLMQQARDYYS